LLGLTRVRLKSEIPTTKPYRIAAAETLQDVEPDGPLVHERSELISLFRAVIEKRERLDGDFATLLTSGVLLGVLSDVIAHALTLPADVKQSLLAETDVSRRIKILQLILRQISVTREPRSAVHPPFSPN